MLALTLPALSWYDISEAFTVLNFVALGAYPVDTSGSGTHPGACAFHPQLFTTPQVDLS